MNDWNWNPLTKTIGEFTLGAPYADLKTPLEHLCRYDYEEFDTCLIEDVKHSKLFVIDGLIYSIQCGLHCVMNGTDLIGKSIEEAQAALATPLHIAQEHPRWPSYMNGDRTIEFLPDNEQPNGPIIWIIIRDFAPKS